MALVTKYLSLLFLYFLVLSIFFVTPSISATDTFVFGGCSQLKFTSRSPYEYSVDSILTSLVNSAMFASYNKFTVPAAGGSTSDHDTVYGLYQCRGDLSSGDCGRCVAKAVSQIGTLCFDSTGGVLQLEGCLVKYDNVTFLGVEDKTVVEKRCGPSISSGTDGLARRDALLSYMEASDGTYKPFRVGGSGNLRGVAQCVGDLDPSECQDCLSEAIGQLKTECVAAKWGDLYMAKCYARYSEGGEHSHAGKGNRFRHLLGGCSSYLLLIFFFGWFELEFAWNLLKKDYFQDPPASPDLTFSVISRHHHYKLYPQQSQAPH